MEITPVLAAVVDITGGEDGGHVVVDPMGPMLMSALYLCLLLAPLVLILFLLFYKKKLQHQQILAAMEKGLPVADLIEKPRNKEVNWVRSLSAGIGFLFVGSILTGIWIWLYRTGEAQPIAVLWLIIPAVILGLGLIYLFRGIFQRNYEKPPCTNMEFNSIGNLSAGVGLLFMAFAMVGFYLWADQSPHTETPPPPFLLVPSVIGGLGLILLVKGILQKNYEKRHKKEKSIPAE